MSSCTVYVVLLCNGNLMLTIWQCELVNVGKLLAVTFQYMFLVSSQLTAGLCSICVGGRPGPEVARWSPCGGHWVEHWSAWWWRWELWRNERLPPAPPRCLVRHLIHSRVYMWALSTATHCCHRRRLVNDLESTHTFHVQFSCQWRKQISEEIHIAGYCIHPSPRI